MLVIVLIVYLAGCSTKNKIPTAQFTITPGSGRAPLSVSLDASASSDSDGEISSYRWDFGNGDSKEGKTAEYVFTQAGEYKATLTITDDDGGEHSTDKTVTVAKNSVPVANSQKLTTKQNISIDIVLTASDLEGDSLVYTIKDDPKDGVLTGKAPNINYQSSSDFVGIDQFIFRVNDGYDESSLATVDITVTDALEPNDNANQATDITFDSVIRSFVNPLDDIDWFNFNLEEDSIVRVNVRTKDIGSNLPLSFKLLDEDKNEVVEKDTQEDVLQTSLTVGSYYVVIWNSTQGNIFENDLTQLASSDQFYDIEVTIISLASNPPVAKSQEVATKEDVPLEIALAGSDADGDELTYMVVSKPNKGKLTGSAPDLTYTPDANVNGKDSFAFKVNDSFADSSPANVDITITPVNDVPVAEPQNVTGKENTEVSVVLKGTDIDDDKLSYLLDSQPRNGQIAGVPPDITYIPNKDFNGEDKFSFIVSDGELNSSVSTVSITVISVDTPAIFPIESTCAGKAVGETCTVTVALRENAASYKGFGFKITSTPDNFLLKDDITIGELPKDCFVAAIPPDNAVIGICQSGQEFTGNGTLVTLTFECKAASISTFTINNPKATAIDNQTISLLGDSLVVN